MDSYVTGTAIRQLREAKHLTQAELAEKLAVSAKAISKWETGRGLPDISLLEPLAAALGVSVLELMQGEPVVNRNRSANLLRSKLYVCPLCGNVLHATGQAVVSCCGIPLPPLDGYHVLNDLALKRPLFASPRAAMAGQGILILLMVTDILPWFLGWALSGVLSGVGHVAYAIVAALGVL